MQFNLASLRLGRVFKAARHVRPFDLGFALAKLIHSQADDSSFSLGIITTKNLGGAVERNRVRRRIKHAFHLACKHCNPKVSNLAVILIGKKCEAVPFSEMVKTFEEFLVSHFSRNWSKRLDD